MLTITPVAQKEILQLLQTYKKGDVLGIRIVLRTKGCSGLMWDLEIARNKLPTDDEFPLADGFSVVIDKKATLYILGTTLDYVENDLESGFVFINPNEKGKCGCGQSFYV